MKGPGGEIERVAASSAGVMGPAQTAKAIALGFKPIRVGNVSGPLGHAERNIINRYADENGMKVR